MSLELCQRCHAQFAILFWARVAWPEWHLSLGLLPSGHLCYLHFSAWWWSCCLKKAWLCADLSGLLKDLTDARVGSESRAGLACECPFARLTWVLTDLILCSTWKEWGSQRTAFQGSAFFFFFFAWSEDSISFLLGVGKGFLCSESV